MDEDKQIDQKRNPEASRFAQLPINENDKRPNGENFDLLKLKTIHPLNQIDFVY
jgi:hypothetical protein